MKDYKKIQKFQISGKNKHQMKPQSYLGSLQHKKCHFLHLTTILSMLKYYTVNKKPIYTTNILMIIVLRPHYHAENGNPS